MLPRKFLKLLLILSAERIELVISLTFRSQPYHEYHGPN